MTLFHEDPTIVAFSAHLKDLIKRWRERREAFVAKKMEILRANGTAQRLGLGIPEKRCDTTEDGITVKFQQAERDDSARPVPPFPWPYVQLLNSPEELKRLQDIWIETMVIRARRASTPSSNTTNSCDICNELFIPGDSTTVIEYALCPSVKRKLAHIGTVFSRLTKKP